MQRAVVLMALFVALGCAQDFTWLAGNQGWTQNNKLYRSSAESSNVNLFDPTSKAPWKSAKGSEEQWVVADLGQTMTVNSVALITTSDETSPKVLVVSTGPTIDGPWAQVAKVDVAQNNQQQNFPQVQGTGRFWRFQTLKNWGSDEGITIKSIKFLAGRALVCGDQIGLKALANRRFWSYTNEQILASAGSRGSNEVFRIFCGHLTDGQQLTYGMQISLWNVAAKRWLADGSGLESDSESPVVVDLGEGDATPQDNEIFAVFNPKNLNDRAAIPRGAAIGIRNHLTRFVGVLDGQTELRSFQYGSKGPEERAQHIPTVVREWIETGCSDGTREGFVALSLFPNIAGCAATWSSSLGMCPPGHVGTNDGQFGCSACAKGWHVCGSGAFETEQCNQVTEGADPEEVFRHVCYAECRSQPGIFASAATHASSSVAPPFQGSNHECGVCSETTDVLGCGTAAKGASGTGVGADCSNFPELKKVVFASGNVPMPVDCLDNKACLGSGMGCCARNDDKGKVGDWRGVLCCKDNVFSSFKRC